MTRTVFLAGAIASLLLLAGCFQYVNEPLPPEDRAAELAGTWVSELDGLMVTFGEDGRYLVQFPDGGDTLEGNYAVDGVGVNLVNDSDAAVCPGEIGAYTFVARKVSGVSFLVQKLQGRFMLVEDTCAPRLAHMMKPYIKQ